MVVPFVCGSIIEQAYPIWNSLAKVPKRMDPLLVKYESGLFQLWLMNYNFWFIWQPRTIIAISWTRIHSVYWRLPEHECFIRYRIHVMYRYVSYRINPMLWKSYDSYYFMTLYFYWYKSHARMFSGANGIRFQRRLEESNGHDRSKLSQSWLLWLIKMIGNVIYVRSKVINRKTHQAINPICTVNA